MRPKPYKVKKGACLVFIYALWSFIHLVLSETMSHAGSCREWVTVSNECSSSCFLHGSSCNSYQCYGSPFYYTSETAREFWQVFPAWIATELGQRIVRNGVVCKELCTKVTQQFQCPVCSNKITTFTADKTVIYPSDAVKFSYDYSGCVDSVTLTIDANTYTDPHSATWNGTDPDFQVLEPKKYPATLTISGECCGTAKTTIDITLLPPPKICPVRIKSSVHVTTGALLQTEPLFAAKGGNLALAMTFTYDSLDPRVGPLGAKWSHSYDIALTLNPEGSATLREGNTRTFFDFVNGAFVPESEVVAVFETG